MRWWRRLQWAWLACAVLFAWPARALTPEQAARIAAGDNDERIAALRERVAAADAALLPLLRALADDAVRVAAGRAYIVAPDGQARLAGGDATPLALPAGAEDVVNNNRMRREIEAAAAALALLSTDRAQRARALEALKDEPDPARAPLVERALAAETDAQLRPRLQALLAAMRIAAPEPAQRVAAARALQASGDPATRALLLQRLAVEADPDAKAAMQAALDAVTRRLAWGERLGTLVTGVSLGSVLLLAALGLAITYGLMGVINMAHGELIMIGAYATWGVQNLFRAWWPGLFDAYLLLALPAAFLASALVGAVLERLVIRHLYGRPLETLLATWGISLMLMQAVRSMFGAQNVAVENPGWLSGGLALLPNLVLPYSRIAIIVFAVLVLAAVALLIARTRLGLYVRAVTGNRRMAACVGVDTARVDTVAFSLGAGIAGLAGCALSQIGNVGPDLGASTIVDSFMVVVLGGVGQLAGTAVAALGLGLASKAMEGLAGAVLAKIAVLLFIVVFIQKRPQGLFALKGRQVE